jgi:hypothetical protein
MYILHLFCFCFCTEFELRALHSEAGTLPWTHAPAPLSIFKDDLLKYILGFVM